MASDAATKFKVRKDAPEIKLEVSSDSEDLASSSEERYEMDSQYPLPAQIGSELKRLVGPKPMEQLDRHSIIRADRTASEWLEVAELHKQTEKWIAKKVRMGETSRRKDNALPGLRKLRLAHKMAFGGVAKRRNIVRREPIPKLRSIRKMNLYQQAQQAYAID